MNNNKEMGLRNQIRTKKTELENCSKDLKMLTTRQATQQGRVTKKRNEISRLTYQSTLTGADISKLENLKTTLKADEQELENRKSEMRHCSGNETRLILEIGRLEVELNSLNNNSAINYVSQNSYRR